MNLRILRSRSILNLAFVPVRVFAIIASSILPIIVLYLIHSESIRLSLIVVFTALCSTFLALLTSATNVEIIAATFT